MTHNDNFKNAERKIIPGSWIIGNLTCTLIIPRDFVDYANNNESDIGGQKIIIEKHEDGTILIRNTDAYSKVTYQRRCD